MQTLGDVINPKPVQGAELFWVERLASDHVMKYGKKIEVQHIEKLDDKHCPPTSRGRRECETRGFHSWFHHAMDTAY